MTRMSNDWSGRIACWLIAANFAGCEFGPPAAVTVPPADTTPATAQPEVGEPSAAAAEETWMACFIGGSKTGWMHTLVETVGEGPAARRRYAYDDRLTFKRFGQEATIQTRLLCVETLDGRLQEFEMILRTGPEPSVTKGQVRAGQLHLETTTAGKTTTTASPWDAAWGGFFADKRSLQEKPMRPGESRRILALMPIVHQIAEVHLQADTFEAVSIQNRSRQLLRINVTTRLGPTTLKSIAWVDGEGIEWKIRDEQLGMEAFRTTREQAEQAGATAAFDIGESTIVRVERRLERPHATRRIVYRARLRDGDVRKLFATGGTQTVTAVDDRTVEIEVRAIGPRDPEQIVVADSARPTPGDSATSNTIQSDDPRIVAMARLIAADETEPAEIACGLEKLVKAKITSKNYSTALATAAEVAKSLEGDCTEHSVLLAALCRARGIPARVAIGLVYYSAQQAFAYHMWNEVWIGDRWLPLDGTLGQAGIGAAHLKLLDSNLAGGSGLSEMLPVIQVIGRLELEIVEVDMVE